MTDEQRKQVDYVIQQATDALNIAIADIHADEKDISEASLETALAFSQANSSLAIAIMLRDLLDSKVAAPIPQGVLPSRVFATWDLSVRAKNCLYRLEQKGLELNYSNLKDIKLCGRITFREIIRELELHGMSTGDLSRGVRP